MDRWQIHLRIRSSWRTNESQKPYNSSQVYSPTSAQRSAANRQRSRPFLLLQNEAVLKEQNHSMPMPGPVASSALQFCGWILFMKRALWCCYLQPLCRMHKSLCSILWEYSSQRSDSLVLNCVINVCVCAHQQRLRETQLISSFQRVVTTELKYRFFSQYVPKYEEFPNG